MWTLFNDGFPFVQPTGAQLRPFSKQNLSAAGPGSAFVAALQNGFQQVAYSRTSAKFGTTYPGSKEQQFDFLMAVLNPPADLKQKFIATAIKIFSVTPTPPFLNFEGEIFKSLLTPLMWSFHGHLATSFGAIVGEMLSPVRVLAAIGGQAFPVNGIPILTTDGSDGEYPQLLLINSPQDFIRAQEVILSGEFWIPFLYEIEGADDETTGLVEVAWPHSSAQGGA